MTFNEYLSEYKANGGTQKGFGLDIGISEAQMSRLVHRTGTIGLRMINRIVGASRGIISAEEAVREFRPDIHKLVMKEGQDAI